LRDQEHASLSRSAVVSGGLRVEANGRAAKKTSECGREGQVVCGIDFHEEAPFLVGPRDFLRRVVVFVRVRGREPLETLALPERGGQQLVSKRKNDPGDKRLQAFFVDERIFRELLPRVSFAASMDEALR
jgi:hypothetical protein